MSKRELIIEAALDVVGEEGLSGFTQPRVSQRAGLRQSHLTYYYPTRDELLVAVAEEAVRRRLSSFNAVLAARDRLSKVDAAVAILIDPAQTRVLVALVQAADTHPAIRESFAGLSTGLFPIGADLLRAFDVEVTTAAQAILRALASGIAVQALAAGGADPSTHAKQLLLAFFTDHCNTGDAHGRLDTATTTHN